MKVIQKIIITLVLLVGTFAQAMQVLTDGDAIVTAMWNLSRGVATNDVALAGNSALYLEVHREALRRMNFKQIEQKLAAKWGVQQELQARSISAIMQLFLKDLIVVGQAELLDLLLKKFDVAYEGAGVNWLYMGERTPYTMLDKALRLRMALQRNGNPTGKAQRIIKILIDNGGETYANLTASK